MKNLSREQQTWNQTIPDWGKPRELGGGGWKWTVHRFHAMLWSRRMLEKVQQHSRVMVDQPMSPRDWATYWVEYVLRHQGATHLRSPAAHIPWFVCRRRCSTLECRVPVQAITTVLILTFLPPHLCPKCHCSLTVFINCLYISCFLYDALRHLLPLYPTVINVFVDTVPRYQLYNADVWGTLVVTTVLAMGLASWLSYRILLALVRCCCVRNRKTKKEWGIIQSFA